MFTIQRFNGALGARLHGVDFSRGISRELLDSLATALWQYQVVAIAADNLTPEQHLHIALHFGEPEHNATDYFQRIDGVPHITVVDSEAGDRADMWHADETFLPQPPVVNLLHAKHLPEYGGETAFISTAAAYDALSNRFKTLLEGLTALHDLAMTYEAGWRHGLPLAEHVARILNDNKRHSHSVVMTHPHSGRRWLNVNATYTRFIEGLPPLEGEMLLQMLLRHLQKPEFSYRHHWQTGDLVLWDQRAVQHYAVRDFEGRRLLHRISVMPHDQ